MSIRFDDDQGNHYVRESDVRADRAYVEKKDFYDRLGIEVQKNCALLAERARNEAQTIRKELAILISNLPSRVQKMTVKEFCKEFHFELIDGELMTSGNEMNDQSKFPVTQTVQINRVKEYKNITPSNAGIEVISQLEIVRSNVSSETYLRMTKNGTKYNLTQNGIGSMSEDDKRLVAADVTAFLTLLKNVKTQ